MPRKAKADDGTCRGGSEKCTSARKPPPQRSLPYKSQAKRRRNRNHNVHSLVLRMFSTRLCIRVGDAFMKVVQQPSPAGGRSRFQVRRSMFYQTAMPSVPKTKQPDRRTATASAAAIQVGRSFATKGKSGKVKLLRRARSARQPPPQTKESAPLPRHHKKKPQPQRLFVGATIVPGFRGRGADAFVGDVLER